MRQSSTVALLMPLQIIFPCEGLATMLADELLLTIDRFLMSLQIFRLSEGLLTCVTRIRHFTRLLHDFSLEAPQIFAFTGEAQEHSNYLEMNLPTKLPKMRLISDSNREIYVRTRSQTIVGGIYKRIAHAR